MTDKIDYGWVRLHRKIKKNPIWNIKPYSKGQAWVDLIMSANHEPAQLILGNEILNIERGQFHTSELKLAEEWGWSRKKVRAYLRTLIMLKMATTVGTSKGTTITVENYEEYQGQGTTEDTTQGTLEEHQKNIKRTTQGTQTRMIKNDKNEKNDKEDKNKHKYGSYENVLLSDTDYEKLVNEFPNDYQERIENLSEGIASKGYKYKDHLATIRSWARREKKDKPKSKLREVIMPPDWNFSDLDIGGEK